MVAPVATDALLPLSQQRIEPMISELRSSGLMQ